MSRWVATYRARVEAKGALHGLAYPWWIATFSAVGQIGFVIAAAAQRDILAPPTWALVPIGLVVVPHLSQFLTRAWIPWWQVAVFGLVSVTWLLAGYPVVVGVDTAAAVLAIVVAEVAAMDGPKVGLGVTVVSIVVLVATGRLDPVVVHVVEVLFGFVVGCMLSWQMRALAAERAARAGPDDQDLVRSGLRRILRRRDGFEIVAEYSDGAEIPGALSVDDADVVVMDLRMRQVDGIDQPPPAPRRPEP